MENLKGLIGFAAWSVYNKVVFNLIFLRQFNIRQASVTSAIDKIMACDDVAEIHLLIPSLIETANRANPTQKQCLATFKYSTDNEKQLMFLECLSYANLENEEVIRLLALHKDSNNISYDKTNVINIETENLIPLLLESLLHCSRLNCDLSLITQEEIDSIKGARVDVKAEVAEIIGNNSDIETRDLLTLAVKRIMNIFKKNNDNERV